MELKERLPSVPRQSGVYLLKDGMGEVLYVGKARSLRDRLRAYFQKGDIAPRMQLLQGQIHDFEFFITGNEVEALILESNLIKKYQPKFNIRLKDDKTYPYIKVTIQETYPAVYKTRLVKKDGSRYFGPYTSVDAVNRTLKLLQKLFCIRGCRKNLDPARGVQRPCLNYHIKRCLAPCAGEAGPVEYQQLIERVMLFLEGRQEDLMDKVEEAMHKAAAAEDFEKAAAYRDTLMAMGKVQERQEVVWDDDKERDILGMAVEKDRACIQLFQVRHGRLLGRDHFFLEGVEGEADAEILRIFLLQYYEAGVNIPGEILVPVPPAQTGTLKNWLQKGRGRRVLLVKPQRGRKARMVRMARENAARQLEQELMREEASRRREMKDMHELKEVLGLAAPPMVIEGFDISNLLGEEAVGSMVVFHNGHPAVRFYRRFKIKTIEGANDVAMLQEVLRRRLVRLRDEGGRVPDLILIDGGKGQVNGAYTVLVAESFADVTILGLAKKQEEIYFPGRNSPLILPYQHRGLQLLQRVRDEAHRFAVGYHRQLRLRSMTHSLLEEIPGVGPMRRKALLAHFGSLAAIRQADIKALTQVTGISSRLAVTIRNFVQQNIHS